MNLFNLAELQLHLEDKEPTDELILLYAIKIRRWLDKHRIATARRILAGGRVYYYRNRVVVSKG
jgi:hypothetical protein